MLSILDVGRISLLVVVCIGIRGRVLNIVYEQVRCCSLGTIIFGNVRVQEEQFNIVIRALH